VVTEAAAFDLVAYYAWCMASITPAQASACGFKGRRPLSPARARWLGLGVDLSSA